MDTENSNILTHMDADLVQMAKETEKEKEEQTKQEVQAMLIGDTLDDSVKLSSWGYTEPLKVTKDGKSEYIKLRIKSVGVQDLIERNDANAPRPPSSVKHYKKGSAEANALGSTMAVIVRELDYSDPDYVKKTEEHQRVTGQLLVLQGIGHNMTDPKDNKRVVVRALPLDQPNEIVDQDAALARMRAMGITGAHFANILQSIRDLTSDEEKRQDQE